MTFIPVNFDDVVEPKPAPNGTYNLQITKAEVVQTGQNSKNPGRDQFKVTIGLPEEADVPNVMQFISLPHEDDEPSSAKFKALLLKRFLVLFNIPFNNDGFDIEQLAMEMVGASAHAELTLAEPDDNGNVYNRLKVPAIKGEASGPGRASPPNRR